jgi:prepilin signal peptidase PulO-like enzyme (type II secretory pathway)
MVVPVAFFVCGIPVAFLLERLIWRLTDFEPDSDESSGRKLLPWQVEPSASRLRVSIVLGVPFVLAASAFRFTPSEAVLVSVFSAALLVCTATDLLRYRVPNVVTYPGFALALICSAALPGGDLRASLFAVILAAGFFVPIWVLTRGGIGMADVKLAVFIAAALGLPAAFTALALGVAAGGAVMLTLLVGGAVSRRQVTPYAPFLAVSAIGITLTEGAAFAPL